MAKDFACHVQLKASLGVDNYFARLYPLWERGVTKNRNWLIRQYSSNGMVLDKGLFVD